MLLAKVPGQYKPAFAREGVFHEIETVASRSLISPKAKEKEKEKDVVAPPTPSESIIVPAPTSAAIASAIPGYRKLSSLALDPEDAITFRARVIRFKYLSDGSGATVNGVLSDLKRIGETLATVTITEDEAKVALRELARLFCSADTMVSSFELLQSGVVDALMKFATSKDWNSRWSSLLLQFHSDKLPCSEYWCSPESIV
jgi:E3 ubiquitin-protein ligase TRIP12